MRFPPGSRVDGPDGGREFDRIELDLARDRHARAAMEAYADSCAAELPWLSEALHLSRFVAAERLTQCSSTVLRVFVMAQSRAAAQPDYAHAAWEHVRSHLTALLSGLPSPAGEAAKPGSNEGKFDYHE
ncbi:peptidase [Paraburkholderia guartelaensis]|nr:peptidase [Paraburkholderia guartelaensis]